METFNYNDPENETDIRTVLDKLRNQDFPEDMSKDMVETIVVTDKTNHENIVRLLEQYPEVKCIKSDNPHYLAMKDLGAQHATRDIVAFLDCDCIPSDNWIKAIVETICEGAGVSVGKTEIKSDTLYQRVFNFSFLMYIQTEKKTPVKSFFPNNVAFKRELLENIKLYDIYTRSGALPLIINKVIKNGYKPVYSPKQSAIHDYAIAKGLNYINVALRSGYEAIYFARMDEDNLLFDTKLLRFGFLAPLLISSIRALTDFKRVFSKSSKTMVRSYEIPLFIASAVHIRSIETIGGIMAMINPGYLRKKLGF
ncbi:MAG: glycosyltransferase [Nitrospirota bacterium]